jgi:hypothetical protein
VRFIRRATAAESTSFFFLFASSSINAHLREAWFFSVRRLTMRAHNVYSIDLRIFKSELALAKFLAGSYGSLRLRQPAIFVRSSNSHFSLRLVHCKKVRSCEQTMAPPFLLSLEMCFKCIM